MVHSINHLIESITNIIQFANNLKMSKKDTDKFNEYKQEFGTQIEGFLKVFSGNRTILEKHKYNIGDTFLDAENNHCVILTKNYTIYNDGEYERSALLYSYLNTTNMDDEQDMDYYVKNMVYISESDLDEILMSEKNLKETVN